jgi:hypothetical protein
VGEGCSVRVDVEGEDVKARLPDSSESRKNALVDIHLVI